MPGVLEPNTLAGMTLFRGLSPEQLAKINTLLNQERFPAAADIIIAEQLGEIVYVVLDGSLKVYITQPEGNEVILAILGAGEIVGEMSLVDSLGRSANVRSLEKSTLLWMDRTTFQTVREEVPTFNDNLLKIMSRRLRMANSHLRLIAALDVHGRVASQILTFAQEYGESARNGDILIPLRLTQTDLAKLVGASRVRVNQVLSFFRQRGYISVGKDGRITVRDSAALIQRAR